jgi:hypothetical protein
VNREDAGVSFWQPVEEPGTRPLRSRVFEFGCAIFAGVASLAHFALGQTAHPPPLSQAASLVVVVLTAAALPLRRVWPGPVFLYTVLAAVLAQWASGRMRRSGCRAAPGWRRLRLWRAIATSRSLGASAR